jgi:adenylosuccinate lyase
MRAFHERRDFKAVLQADPDVIQVLGHDDIERAFDLNTQLQHIDYVFDRVFQEVTV